MSCTKQPTCYCCKQQIHVRQKVISIATYDFPNIGRNISHNKVKKVVRELINTCFKGGEKQLITATKFGATWTNDKNKSKSTFDKASPKLAINLQLNNFFFDSNAFIRLSNQLLKRMPKHGSKQKSNPMSNTIFGEHFNVFKVLADTADNFIKVFSVDTEHANYWLFDVFFFVYSLVCLFACMLEMMLLFLLCFVSMFCFYLYPFFLFVSVNIVYIICFSEIVIL